MVFIHGAFIADTFRPLLAEPSQPTLSVLGGESDALWSRFGETHRLLAWLPYAEGFVLPGARHFMQIEDPPGMAEVLAAFWARHRLPAGVA